MHYYQFNIGDYAKSTLHLSLMEDLAYRRLLDRYYDTEKPLDTDVDKLCRFIRMQSHKKETQQVLEEFFSITQKGWIQKRVAKELDTYSLKADTARANGKKGGRPKKTQWVNDRNPDLTQEKAKQEPLNKNHKPLTIKQEPINNKEIKITNGRFSPPTQTEVFEYMKSRDVNNMSEAESFFDYYTSNGWKVGGKAAMKDWKATVRRWVKKYLQNNKTPRGYEQ